MPYRSGTTGKDESESCATCSRTTRYQRDTTWASTIYETCRVGRLLMDVGQDVLLVPAVTDDPGRCVAAAAAVHHHGEPGRCTPRM